MLRMVGPVFPLYPTEPAHGLADSFLRTGILAVKQTSGVPRGTWEVCVCRLEM